VITFMCEVYQSYFFSQLDAVYVCVHFSSLHCSHITTPKPVCTAVQLNSDNEPDVWCEFDKPNGAIEIDWGAVNRQEIALYNFCAGGSRVRLRDDIDPETGYLLPCLMFKDGRRGYNRVKKVTL